MPLVSTMNRIWSCSRYRDSHSAMGVSMAAWYATRLTASAIGALIRTICPAGTDLAFA